MLQTGNVLFSLTHRANALKKHTAATVFRCHFNQPNSPIYQREKNQTAKTLNRLNIPKKSRLKKIKRLLLALKNRITSESVSECKPYRYC